MQMRDTEHPLQKLQILQILQNCPNEIWNPHCRNSKYRRIIQRRNREPPPQKSQILQKYCRIMQMRDTEPLDRRNCKYCRTIQMRDREPPLQKLQILQISQSYPNERYRAPIAKIADIANIAELCKRDSKCPLQKLQISQNYPD